MKNLTNLTEYEIISAAYDHYIVCWDEAQEKLKENPSNEILENRARNYWNKTEELRAILLEMEKNGENQTKWNT